MKNGNQKVHLKMTTWKKTKGGEDTKKIRESSENTELKK